MNSFGEASPLQYGFKIRCTEISSFSHLESKMKQQHSLPHPSCYTEVLTLHCFM
uniref:Uncharacterized protein n=1 Tax=Anguilla anguilla TaxID=7936 RepID=A0A0E9Y0U7_ANGAN